MLKKAEKQPTSPNHLAYSLELIKIMNSPCFFCIFIINKMAKNHKFTLFLVIFINKIANNFLVIFIFKRWPKMTILPCFVVISTHEIALNDTFTLLFDDFN